MGPLGSEQKHKTGRKKKRKRKKEIIWLLPECGSLLVTKPGTEVSEGQSPPVPSTGPGPAAGVCWSSPFSALGGGLQQAAAGQAPEERLPGGAGEDAGSAVTHG